jgi:four helix bundle protein
MGDFKKLRVWADSCVFADRVEAMAYALSQPHRQWAFDQLVPAAHAIHENLAEGWGFDSDPQRLKYCRQALSTANESEDELLALERKAMLTGDFAKLTLEARSICAQLASLKQRIEASIAASRPRRASRHRPRRKPPAEQ